MKPSLKILRLTALSLGLLGGILAARAHDDELPAIIPGQPPINGIVLIRVLNDAQRAQYRQAQETNRAQILVLEQQILAARKALLEIQLAEKFDEAAYRARVEEILKAQTGMEVLNARAFAKVRPSLTPEQLARLRSSPPLSRPYGGSEARPGVFPMGAPVVPPTHRPPTNGPQVVIPPQH